MDEVENTRQSLLEHCRDPAFQNFLRRFWELLDEAEFDDFED